MEHNSSPENTFLALLLKLAKLFAVPLAHNYSCTCLQRCRITFYIPAESAAYALQQRTAVLGTLLSIRAHTSILKRQLQRIPKAKSFS